VTARLASSVLVTALLRRAESQSGFGAILARGDSSAGAILVVLLERGANPRLLERVLGVEGRYHWAFAVNRAAGEAGEMRETIERRLRFDPDLWVVELDIPSAEHFAAGMNEMD
jgi:hypothetical protein